jgi:hypothetical protein
LIVLIFFLVGPPFLSPFILSASATLHKIPALPLDISEREVDRVVLKSDELFRVVHYRNLLPFLNRYEVLDPRGSRVTSREVIMRVLIVSAMKSENVTKLIMAVDFENLRKIVMVAMDVEGELGHHLSTFDGILSFLSTVEKNELYRVVVLFKPEVDSVFREIKSTFMAFYADLARWVEGVRRMEITLFEIASEIRKVQANQSADLELLYDGLASIDCVDAFYDMVVKGELLSSSRSYIQSTITRPFDQLRRMLSSAPEDVKKAAEQVMEAISSRILSGVSSLMNYIENTMFSKLLMSSKELSERLLHARSDLAVIREAADKRIEEMKYPINLSNNARQLFLMYVFVMLLLAVELCITVHDYRVTHEKRSKRKIAFKVLLSLTIFTPLILSLVLANEHAWQFIEMNNSVYLKPFPTPPTSPSAPSFLWGLILLAYYIMLPIYSYVYPLSYNDVFLVTPIPLLQYVTFVLYCAGLLLVYATLRSAFQDEDDFVRSLVNTLISYVVAGVVGGIVAYVFSSIAPGVIPFLVSFSVIAYSLHGLINRESFYLSFIACLVSFSTLVISFAAFFILGLLHGTSNVLAGLLAGLLLFGGAGMAFMFLLIYALAMSGPGRWAVRLIMFTMALCYVLLVLVVFSYAWGLVAVYGQSAMMALAVSCLIATLLFGFHALIATLIWRISGKLCDLIRRGHK